MKKIEERNVFGFMIIFLIFIALAFERDLAYIYLLMIVGDFFFWFTDKNKRIVTERTTTNRLRALLFAVGSYGIFILLSTILMQQLQTTIPITGTQSIFDLLATSTPILKGSIVLTIISWGLIVPIVETRFFFGRLFEYFADWYQKLTGSNIPLDKFSGKTIVLILVISSLFSLFHITSKQAASLPMIITFIFGVISCILVVRHQELKAAIIFHISTNMVAVLSQVGII